MASRTRSQRLNGFNPLAYLGVTPLSPVNFTINNRPPTVNDYANFYVGDTWLDNSSYPTPPKSENFWMLVSKAGGESTWVNFGGGAAILTLTGNVGGPVPGDVNDNINTIGDNIGITVTGNPLTNTLTWSLVGGGVATQSYLTDDANVEVPNAAGRLTVTGTGVLSAGNVYSNLSTLRGVNVNTIGTVLNSSIGQPNTTANGLQGMYSLGGSANLVTDRFMFNYGTHNTFLGNFSGNLTLTVGNAQNNTCVGYFSGNSLTTGNQNVIIGSSAGIDINSSSNCTYVGYAAGIANTGAGNQNSGFGSQVLNGVTTGARNSAFGGGSLFVTTGSDNVAAGQSAGSGYLSTESSNIIIGSQNFGTALENNTLRIGNASGAGEGNLSRAFIQGIYGVNPPGGGVKTVVQDMNGQLGTMTGGTPLFNTTAFYAWSNGTMGATPFVLGTFSVVPINNVGAAGYDLGGNFNVGTFSYVCPNTGYYWFNAMITTTLVPNTVTECTMGFSGGASGTFGPMSFNPNNYQSGGPGTGMCFGGSWLSTLLVAGTNVNIQVLFGGAGALPDVEGGTARTFLQGYQIA